MTDYEVGEYIGKLQTRIIELVTFDDKRNHPTKYCY